MNHPTPITRDSEICQVISCLPDKFIVDFANGIDVTRDHLREQRQRSGMYARLYDGFTGQGAKRQEEINANLAKGLESAFTWLNDLTESLTCSNYAIEQVNDRVSVITKNVAILADDLADTRQQLHNLSANLHKRCDQLSEEIVRIGFEQRAERQLTQVINKWAAGRFNSLPYGARCYAVLEELRWGDFGDYCRRNTGQTRNGFLDDLTNRAISQLARDTGLQSYDRRETEFWLTIQPEKNTFLDATEAITYLGDWSRPESRPFVYSITQFPENRPIDLPYRLEASRLASALVSEVFEDQQS